MRVVAKTLNGEVVECSVDMASGDVRALKAALCAERSDWSVDRIRIACNGAALKDESAPLTPVADYLGGGAGRFIVVVVKAAPAPAATAAPATATAAPPPPPPSLAAPAAPLAPPVPLPHAAPQAPSSEASVAAPHGSPELTTLVEMGFERSAAEAALREGGGNLSRAVDWLTGGGGGGSGSGNGSGSGGGSGGSDDDAAGSGGRTEAGVRTDAGLGVLGRQARASSLARELASDRRQVEYDPRDGMPPRTHHKTRAPLLGGISQVAKDGMTLRV